MSSTVDKIMEEQDEKKIVDAEIIETDQRDSEHPHNPFCYKPSLVCSCHLDPEECLTYNSKPDRRTCEYFHNFGTKKQNDFRDKVIKDLTNKASAYRKIQKNLENTIKRTEKIAAYGCSFGCLILSIALLTMGVGVCMLLYKFSVDFVLWVADKF